MSDYLKVVHPTCLPIVRVFSWVFCAFDPVLVSVMCLGHFDGRKAELALGTSPCRLFVVIRLGVRVRGCPSPFYNIGGTRKVPIYICGRKLCGSISRCAFV